MPQLNIITELLGVKEECIEKYSVDKEKLEVWLKMPVKAHECPECTYVTSLVHDYRERTIKDIPLRIGLNTILYYNQRRYCCPVCGKKFSERQGFVPKYSQYTNQMNLYLYNQLSKEYSLTSIAKDNFTSTNKMHRILQEFSITAPASFPEVISIDEFKGNAGNRKYQFIINDMVNKKVFDVLKGRESHILSEYFSKFERKEREKVKFVVMDMSRAFREVISVFFPNAQIVIDKFHVVRYCTWSLEAIRKDGQKRLQKDLRKFFKNSRKLLNKRKSRLNEDQKEQVALMLQILPELQQGYFLKEKFYSFVDSNSSTEAAIKLKEFLFHAEALDLLEFKAMVTMLKNWGKYIMKMFEYSFSNGFTEGKNNKIKVLKRNAYGFRNFENMRKRILLMT